MGTFRVFPSKIYQIGDEEGQYDMHLKTKKNQDVYHIPYHVSTGAHGSKHSTGTTTVF